MIYDLITPLMLTISPSLKEMPNVAYDWKTQKSVIQAADGSFSPNTMGTWRSTSSLVKITDPKKPYIYSHDDGAKD